MRLGFLMPGGAMWSLSLADNIRRSPTRDAKSRSLREVFERDYLCEFHLRNGNGHSRYVTKSLRFEIKARRSHIIANSHRYIGKETSRRWEQGDDVSMVDFVCA